ncbi:MAG TPA: hypothetical protein VMU25_03035 [Candidatus Paceibacterota bacterium]|nr:hypothetical protein [Candidatus Paceibacterota bacterium]
MTFHVRNAFGILIGAALVTGVCFFAATAFASIGETDISAQDSPITSTSVAAACLKEKNAAAARGFSDTKSVISDQTGLQFQDSCVTAILNPTGGTLNPKDPNSYICVGKRATVNVAANSLITESAVPDPSVPAGTCAAIACSAYDIHNQSSCFAANNLTTLNGQTINNGISAAQSPSITADQGISTFTLNDNGTIAAESPNTTATLNSAVGSENASGLSSNAQSQLDALAQGASAQPTDAQAPTFSGNSSLTDVAQTNVTADEKVTVLQSPSGESTQSFANSQTTFTSPSQSGDSLGQLTGETNIPKIEVPATSQTWYQQLGSSITNGAETLLNDARGWLGLPPIGQGGVQNGPVEIIGIRG